MTDNKELKSMYYLHNYRQVYWDFQKMSQSDEDYSATKEFLDLVKKTAEKVFEATSIPALKEETIKDEKELKQLYYQTLLYSFIEPNKRTSNEIIEILGKNFGILLNASKLSKLKQKSVAVFSSVLED